MGKETKGTRNHIYSMFDQSRKIQRCWYGRCWWRSLQSLANFFRYRLSKEAQKRAEAKGLVVEWGKDGYMKTRYTVSGFEYFPQLDRNLLYSAIADHGSWFDTWPGMAELDYMKTYPDA